MFSPVAPAVFVLLPVFLPELFWQSVPLMIAVNTLVIALAVIALSGVPAALFERLARRPPDDDITMVVWTVSAALLALGIWEVFG